VSFEVQGILWSMSVSGFVPKLKDVILSSQSTFSTNTGISRQAEFTLLLRIEIRKYHSWFNSVKIELGQLCHILRQCSLGWEHEQAKSHKNIVSEFFILEVLFKFGKAD